MNQSIMMGRLVRDPQINYVENSKGDEMAVANFRLAVNRKFSDETDYFPCSAFGRLAEFAEKYLFQGIKVVVNGRMENNNYTNKDGDKVYGVCLKLDDIEFAESKNAGQDHDEDEGKNILYCINPVYVQRLSPADSCRYYRNNKPVRYAKGMTQLFEDLPLKQSRVVRLRVMQCFSCESYFYQSRKGERLITPDEQEAIRRVFRASGVTSEPKFDDFQYSLAWEG